MRLGDAAKLARLERRDRDRRTTVVASLLALTAIPLWTFAAPPLCA
jgi:hypothetical protein